MADGDARISTGVQLGDRAPFRAPIEASGEGMGVVTGEVPSWLRGSLVRTAPARFTVGAWEAGHWFDAMGMLFAFDVSERGVGLRWRDLDSAHARELRAGAYDRGGFGTAMKRGLLQRVTSPIPKVTDNACVNVLPRGEKLVALTETQHQLVVDPRTLAVLGEHQWQDSLGALQGLAHPEFDRARGRWVDVATSFSGRPALIVYEHDVDGRARSVLGRWNPGRIPYVHAFGLSARSAVLIGHPFTVNPLSMLFSNEPYVSHFRWDRGAPTRLALMSRADGTVREVDAPTGFVFHVIDCFDDGDDTVIDVLRYPDADVVRSFSRDRLASERIALAPAPERWRVRPGRTTVESSSLAREGLEFPVIDRGASGPGRRYAWGASAVLDGARSESKVIQVDHRANTTMHYREDAMVFGEPVFVRRPGAVEEGDGVLLAVGSPAGGGGSALVVLDARTLERLARVSVSEALPLGFHGGFVRAKG